MRVRCRWRVPSTGALALPIRTRRPRRRSDRKVARVTVVLLAPRSGPAPCPRRRPPQRGWRSGRQRLAVAPDGDDPGRSHRERDHQGTRSVKPGRAVDGHHRTGRCPGAQKPAVGNDPIRIWGGAADGSSATRWGLRNTRSPGLGASPTGGGAGLTQPRGRPGPVSPRLRDSPSSSCGDRRTSYRTAR